MVQLNPVKKSQFINNLNNFKKPCHFILLSQKIFFLNSKLHFFTRVAYFTTDI